MSLEQNVIDHLMGVQNTRKPAWFKPTREYWNVYNNMVRPSKEGNYFVTFTYDNENRYTTTMYFDGREFEEDACVVAWRELPEPYMGLY